MPDVVFTCRISPNYRVAFHEAVRANLASSGIRYRFLHGVPRPGEDTKQDSAAIHWAEEVRCTYFGPGNRLVWLSHMGRVRGADLVVIGQENTDLANYPLQIWRRFGGPRLAFIGHGKNFQSSKPDGMAARFKRLWIKQVDWWFAYTERSAAIVADAGFPRDRITVFNNAIDTSGIAAQVAALDPAAQTAVRQSQFDGSQNIGVYVGGLYPEKKLSFLIDASRLVREAVPDFHLLIIGGGPDAGIAEAAAAELSWVHYAGPRFGAEKTALASLGRVFLMPGLVGLGVLDSFAYGTPMVTTASPHHGPEIDYLRHGENGLIVANDVRTYAEAVTELLTNEAWRLQLKRGAEAELGTFTIEAMARRFTDGVLDALARPREARGVDVLTRNPSHGRVLVYHETEASRFLPQIREIARQFQFVNIDSAFEILQGCLPLDARRPFTLLTFDDGSRDFLDVMDELHNLGVPACLYLTKKSLGCPGYLSASEVRSISETFDIGSHTLSHPNLLELDEEQLRGELEGSKHFLEDLIGKPVVHFAAPFGGPRSFGRSAIRGAAAAGYQTFRTTFRGWNRPGSRHSSGPRLLRADCVEDSYPSWRLRVTLSGALDWRATYRLGNVLGAEE